jgi:hypothetical protein
MAQGPAVCKRCERLALALEVNLAALEIWHHNPFYLVEIQNDIHQYQTNRLLTGDSNKWL